MPRVLTMADKPAHASNEVWAEVVILSGAVHRAWMAALTHDNLPEDTQFAVFSEDNPFEAKYNKYMAEYLTFRRENNV